MTVEPSKPKTITQALTRNSSGVRDISYLPKEQSRVESRSPSPTLHQDISVTSLIAKKQNQQGYQYRKLLKDPSVTKIDHPGLRLQSSEKRLQPVVEKPERVLKHNPSRSVVDLFTKDLGTMGIPREISHQRVDQNFLFTSSADPAPGSYNPVKPSAHSPCA